MLTKKIKFTIAGLLACLFFIVQPPALCALELFSSITSAAPSATAGGDSISPIISRDGRYVLFSSYANNLAGSSNGSPFLPLFPAKLNVFLRDRIAGTTTLVSINTNGTAGGNGDSFAMGISTNGQFALFESAATNLCIGDTNNLNDVFVRDVINGTTTLVSMATNGGCANGGSRSSIITPDGRHVAFISAANNLVAGDTNGIPDVFMRDLVAATTTLVSVGAISTNNPSLESTSESPDMTPDGRYIAFFSSATNLVAGVGTAGEIYVRDLVGGITFLASKDAHTLINSVFGTTNAISYAHRLSDDGQFVAYQTNPTLSSAAATSSAMVLRYSFLTGLTDVVNTNALGAKFGFEADYRGLDLTPDGRFVAFISNINNSIALNAVEVWDAQSNTLTLASGNITNGISGISDCCLPQLSADGRYVVFESCATNLTSNNFITNYQLFVRDLQLQSTYLANARRDGIGSSYLPLNAASLSTNGMLIAFESLDPYLVTNDFNRGYDAFVFNLASKVNELVSVRAPNLPSLSADGASYFSAFSVSTNARYVAFYSEADNLVGNDTNKCRDVFLHDLLSGSNTLVSVALNGASGNGPSTDAAISGNGRYVAFTSISSNLVSSDNNNAQDVFVRDLQTASTLLISSNISGTGSANGASYSPILSSDGRYVLFRSKASNLIPNFFSTNENLFRYDIQLGIMFALTTNTTSTTNYAAMSPDGRYIAYGAPTLPGYVWDMSMGKKIYTNSAYFTGIAISPDARKLAYSTTNQVYLADLVAKTNVLLNSSTASNHAGMQFSADDRFLVYTAGGTGQMSQIYLFDTQMGTNIFISTAYGSASGGNGSSDSPTISSDGQFIAYRSMASNITPGVSNNLPNIFMYSQSSRTNTLVTLSQYGSFAGNNRSLTPVFSADAQTLLFESWAADLISQDFNSSSDLLAFYLNSSTSFSITFSPPATIAWGAVIGKNYQVQFKNSLTDPNWQTLNGSVTLVGNQWLATDLAPSSSQRFYRVAAY